MSTTRCAECGHEIEFGEFPFCPHGAIRELNARRFESIVVWQSNTEPDKFSFPGQASEPCPDGYHRLEITNLPEADRFVSRMNAIERAKAESNRELNDQALDEQTRRRRNEFDARNRSSLDSRSEALLRAVREWADRRRTEKRYRRSRLDPHFHIQVLSFDSGNRNSYSGPETGWRERKS